MQFNVMLSNVTTLHMPLHPKYHFQTRAPQSRNSAVLVTPLSGNSAVLATPRSRFTVSFNQKAFHTGLKLIFSQETV